MRIAMIGSGYVGLVSGACFAHFGHDVICVDKDAAKIGALEQGVMPPPRRSARAPREPLLPLRCLVVLLCRESPCAVLLAGRRSGRGLA